MTRREKRVRALARVFQKARKKGLARARARREEEWQRLLQARGEEARDPSTSPERLEELALSVPRDVEQNPSLPFLAVSHPERYREIKRRVEGGPWLVRGVSIWIDL